MSRFLLDANLSPRNSLFLRTMFGFDVVDLMSLGLSHIDDAEVMKLAHQEDRIVITEDLDFGRLYFRYEQGRVGIIVLRLRTQSSETVNRALAKFFNDPDTGSIDLENSLVILSETRMRVISEP